MQEGNGGAEDLTDNAFEFPLADLFEMSVLSTFHLTRQAQTLLGASTTALSKILKSWV